MQLDVLIDPFGASWADIRRAGVAAEDAGFDGLWTWDHLAGSVHRADRVAECWTVLSALAEATSRVALGPLVLNVANRPAGTLAVMAATLQDVSGGRLLLGLGAGGGRATPYAAEQLALGRPVDGDVARRQSVEAAVATLREVWTGRAGGASGFAVPAPAPPIVIGAFGPKMAALAGAVGDGINSGAGPGLGRLVAIARQARADSGRDPASLLVTASAGLDSRWWDPSSASRRRIESEGVDRLIMVGSTAAVLEAAAARR